MGTYLRLKLIDPALTREVNEFLNQFDKSQNIDDATLCFNEKTDSSGSPIGDDYFKVSSSTDQETIDTFFKEATAIRHKYGNILDWSDSITGPQADYPDNIERLTEDQKKIVLTKPEDQKAVPWSDLKALGLELYADYSFLDQKRQFVIEVRTGETVAPHIESKLLDTGFKKLTPEISQEAYGYSINGFTAPFVRRFALAVSRLPHARTVRVTDPRQMFRAYKETEGNKTAFGILDSLADAPADNPDQALNIEAALNNITLSVEEPTNSTMDEIGIGFTWPSPDGERRIAGKGGAGSFEYYNVVTIGSSQKKIIPIKDIENYIAKDKEATSPAPETIPDTDDEQFHGFLETLPASRKERVKKALEKPMGAGRIRADIVEDYIYKMGYSVARKEINGRQRKGLMQKIDDSDFLDTSFSKIELEYAQHLRSIKAQSSHPPEDIKSPEKNSDLQPENPNEDITTLPAHELRQLAIIDSTDLNFTRAEIIREIDRRIEQGDLFKDLGWPESPESRYRNRHIGDEIQLKDVKKDEFFQEGKVNFSFVEHWEPDTGINTTLIEEYNQGLKSLAAWKDQHPRTKKLTWKEQRELEGVPYDIDGLYSFQDSSQSYDFLKQTLETRIENLRQGLTADGIIKDDIPQENQSSDDRQAGAPKPDERASQFSDAYRQELVEKIYSKTHKDYRGTSKSVKSILVLREAGTSLVPISSLTDKEIARKLNTTVLGLLENDPAAVNIKYKTGFSWDSKDGKKTILGPAKDRPEGWLEIEKPGSRFNEYIHIDDIDREVNRDAQNLEYQQKLQEQEDQKASQEAAEKAEYEDVHGFAEDMDPKRKATALKTLNKPIRVNGLTVTRKKMIKDLIDAGATTNTREENKVQPMSRKRFNRATQAEQDAHDRRIKEAGTKTVYTISYPEKPESWYVITKTEYDYASYLIGKKVDVSVNDTPPPGWAESRPGALMTNTDPIEGGIIDREIVSGLWFVISHNDNIPKLSDCASRAEAYAALIREVKRAESTEETSAIDEKAIMKERLLALNATLDTLGWEKDGLDEYRFKRIKGGFKGTVNPEGIRRVRTEVQSGFIRVMHGDNELVSIPFSESPEDKLAKELDDLVMALPGAMDEVSRAKPGDILSISDSPRKTNSSFGNWVVDVEVVTPFGNGKTVEQKYFFKKQDAKKFINDQKTALESGSRSFEPGIEQSGSKPILFYEEKRQMLVQVGQGTQGNYTFYRTKDPKKQGSRIKSSDNWFDTRKEAEAALPAYAKKRGFIPATQEHVDLLTKRSFKLPKIKSRISIADLKWLGSMAWGFDDAKTFTAAMPGFLPQAKGMDHFITSMEKDGFKDIADFFDAAKEEQKKYGPENIEQLLRERIKELEPAGPPTEIESPFPANSIAGRARWDELVTPEQMVKKIPQNRGWYRLHPTPHQIKDRLETLKGLRRADYNLEKINSQFEEKYETFISQITYLHAEELTVDNIARRVTKSDPAAAERYYAKATELEKRIEALAVKLNEAQTFHAAANIKWGKTDLEKGDKVIITRALHPEYRGKEGIVKRVIEAQNEVDIHVEGLGRYVSYTHNVKKTSPVPAPADWKNLPEGWILVNEKIVPDSMGQPALTVRDYLNNDGRVVIFQFDDAVFSVHGRRADKTITTPVHFDTEDKAYAKAVELMTTQWPAPRYAPGVSVPNSFILDLGLMGQYTTRITNDPDIPQGYTVVAGEIYKRKVNISKRDIKLYELTNYSPGAFRVLIVENPQGERFSHVEYMADNTGNGGFIDATFRTFKTDALENIRALGPVNKYAAKLWAKHKNEKGDDHAAELINPAAKPEPKETKPWRKPGVVFREIRDHDGRRLGYMHQDYDGQTKEDALAKAQTLGAEHVEAVYPEFSNINSRIGATDTNGNPLFAISPNLKHVHHVLEDRDAAMFTWGDLEAAQRLITDDEHWEHINKYKGYIKENQTEIQGLFRGTVTPDDRFDSIEEEITNTDRINQAHLQSINDHLKKLGEPSYEPEPHEYQMGDLVEYEGKLWKIGFINHTLFKGTFRLKRGEDTNEEHVNYVYPKYVRLISPALSQTTPEEQQESENLFDQKKEELKRAYSAKGYTLYYQFSNDSWHLTIDEKWELADRTVSPGQIRLTLDDKEGFINVDRTINEFQNLLFSELGKESIKKQLDLIKNNQTVVIDDEGLDLIGKIDPEAMNDICSSPNPDRVGTKDVYLAGFASSPAMKKIRIEKGLEEPPPSERKYPPVLHYKEQKYRHSKYIGKLFNELGIAEQIANTEDYYGKIFNEPWQPLTIERHGNMIYLTHYYEQNGDLVMDGEMVFQLYPETGHLILKETAVQNAFRGGELRGCDATFANIFAKNLNQQGFGACKVVDPRKQDPVPATGKTQNQSAMDFEPFNPMYYKLGGEAPKGSDIKGFDGLIAKKDGKYDLESISFAVAKQVDNPLILRKEIEKEIQYRKNELESNITLFDQARTQGIESLEGIEVKGKDPLPNFLAAKYQVIRECRSWIKDLKGILVELDQDAPLQPEEIPANTSNLLNGDDINLQFLLRQGGLPRDPEKLLALIMKKQMLNESQLEDQVERYEQILAMPYITPETIEKNVNEIQALKGRQQIFELAVQAQRELLNQAEMALAQ